MEEGEGTLDSRPGEPGYAAGQIRVAVDSDEVADPLELLVADRRIPGPYRVDLGHGRRGGVDGLQQPVNGVADLGRCESNLTRNGRAGVRGPHPHDPLGVVAIGAAFEESKRAVGESADSMQRRFGDRSELGKPRRRRWQGREVGAREELQLPVGGRRLR
jgi:hypothetical protein